ncbi:CinA family protein [Halocatena salina]|uniref:CinA family protein n=1 Tax=Halocatena salina TaxID=2934340 RepID=A0A8U0A5I7_9EURY|nr:CinA family protein [Halocatena salina]UPM44109.1 CinA family protein [Halocatena salina]
MDNDTENPIERRVGTALREADATVAVAESCTGGLVGSLLTDVPGSSDYFDRTVVTYSYEAKRELLAVSRESLDADGAVSESVARQMAQAIRDTAGTTWGLATTGIAGPEGGTDDKPVGTVYVAVANAAPWGSNASKTTVERHLIDDVDARTERKERFARQTLTDLCDRITSENG